jgi:hypothetical protein
VHVVLALAAAALAGPPVGVDLEDGQRWETAPNALLDGPPGCWEVVGYATWDHDLGRWGSTRGEALFVGRMVDGVWGPFRVFPRGEYVDGAEAPIYVEEDRFTPFFGRVRGLRVRLDRSRDLQVDRSKDPRVEAVSTVDDVLSKLTQDVETWEVSWEEDAVVLTRTGTAGRKEAQVTSRTTFPGGGTIAETHSVALVGTYVHKGLFPARVRALDLRLEGRLEDGVVLPVRETLSFDLGLVVARVKASQEIVYRHVGACPDSPS